MQRRLFASVTLILSLVLTLSVVMPVKVMAAITAMSASGVVTGISESIEKESGSSGRVKVYSRSVYGAFTSGDLTGDFAMTYSANVDLDTQAGNFAGTMTTGGYVFNVNGQSDPVQLNPDYTGTLTAAGSWTLTRGSDGSGTFQTVIYFVPTPDGHIAYVLPGSTISMSGQWKP